METLGAVDVPVYLVLLFTVATFTYVYLTWNHSFFRNQGVPGPKPYPLIGNTLGVGLMQSFQKWKQIYGNAFGVFLGREPVFVICDLDILKEVLVKSFNNFRNRRKMRMASYPFNLGVLFLEDAAWRRVRNIITPTFSSGKLRAMCTDINDCARTLAKNFSSTFNKDKPVDMKEYFGAYTMDVIARTAFGVKVDSQNNFNDPFVTHAKKIFAPNPLRRPFILMAGMFPSLIPVIKALGMSFFPKYISDFFVKNITDMIKERKAETKEMCEKRTDFLQLLMDAEVVERPEGDIQAVHGMTSSRDKHLVRRLTTDEIIGQGLLFFIAGHETTASTLNYASYALATHPDVQDKVYKEIKDVLGDKEPDYDNINKLSYLDSVISETLRLFPPIPFLQRRAAETITIQGLTIPKGSSVFIPTFTIQRDPELFEDPEEFRPERFDEKSNPISFLAFGYGPRICIGMRLALVEAKIALVHVLRRVKFEKGPDTPAKMTFKDRPILQSTIPNMLKLSSRCLSYGQTDNLN